VPTDYCWSVPVREYIGYLKRCIRDEVWADLADPASYFIQAVLLLFGPDPLVVQIRPAEPLFLRTLRVLNSGVVVIVGSGFFFAFLKPGDVSAVALTLSLVLAGTLTFIPAQLVRLRKGGRVRGSAKSRVFRKGLWLVEVVVVVVVAAFAGRAWGPVALGVAAGVSTAFLADLAAALACLTTAAQWVGLREIRQRRHEKPDDDVAQQ
jgi:hypothetical protein